MILIVQRKLSRMNENRTCRWCAKAIEKLSFLLRKKRPRRSLVERAMRIELTTKAWEAFVLPLNYARIVTL